MSHVGLDVTGTENADANPRSTLSNILFPSVLIRWDMSKKPKKLIKSDETMFEIISYLERSGVAGTTEIAGEVDAAKSTVHAHLSTLKRHGFVVNEGGQYRIGMEFLNYGKSAQASHVLYPKVIDKLEYLAGETNERSWCHIEENGMCYYLCGAESEHSVHPPVRVGRSVPMHQVAGGKAMLAHMSDEEIEAIIDRHGLSAKTDATITDPAELFEELATIREQGCAFNRGESLAGLHAVGVPIRNPDGELVGSLSISGPANRLEGEKLKEEVPSLLLGAANELEINIAYE